MVDPYEVVDVVEGQDVSNGVEPMVAEEGADEGEVLLLDTGVVVLVIGARAGQGDAWDEVAPEAQQVIVEKGTVVIGVDSEHWEGWPAEDAAKGVRHDQLATAQDRSVQPAATSMNWTEE